MQTLVALSGVGLLTLFSEIFGFRKLARLFIPAGLLVALVLNFGDWNTNQHLFNDMLVLDNYSVAFTAILIGVSFLWFLLSDSFLNETSGAVDRMALVVFALIGAVCMVNYNHMIMLFLGIEILSISVYVLAGSDKRNLFSNEAALKYFLMGSFATGFLLFGMALIYGSTGSFSLPAIASATAAGQGMMFKVGVVMLMIAMAFKVSAAPFHFWAPDVYQGAPTSVTAFMATVVKTAAFAALFRLFSSAFASSISLWLPFLSAIAITTILLGNVAAAAQSNLKRMLAYSSVAHAGYMLIAVCSMTPESSSSLFYYSISYSLSSLLSFFILLIINEKSGVETADGFRGLASRHRGLAALSVIAFLSLAGIPPTAGFFAKYYLFTAAVGAGQMPLVLVAVAGSLLGVYYYFRPMMAVFTAPTDSTTWSISSKQTTILWILAIATLLLGVFPALPAGILN